jgi:hypothetical protein
MAPAKEEIPVLRTVVLGTTAKGLHACLVLTTHGPKVLSKELLGIGEERGPAEDAWRDEVYRRVFRRENELDAAVKTALAKALAPHKGADVLRGGGYGLQKQKNRWALYRLAFDGDQVDDKEVIDSDEGTDGFLMLWERLTVLASKNILSRDRRPI